FTSFAERIVPGGSLVASADDGGAARLAAKAARDAPGRTVATYGTADEATYRLVELVQGRNGVSFVLTGPFEPAVPVALRLVRAPPGAWSCCSSRTPRAGFARSSTTSPMLCAPPTSA